MINVIGYNFIDFLFDNILENLYPFDH